MIPGGTGTSCGLRSLNRLHPSSMCSFVDLISQREAVRQHVRGWSVENIVGWLAIRGKVSKRSISGQEIFFFESAVGRQAGFFFDNDEMVFLGDHTTFR